MACHFVIGRIFFQYLTRGKFSIKKKTKHTKTKILKQRKPRDTQ